MGFWSKLSRFKIAWILSKSAFWLPIIIPFFNSRGIPSDQVFFLLSVYSIFLVLLEYPTGVIGDYFSHKISITLGYLVSAIAVTIPVFILPLWVYYFSLFLLALGVTLVSGSDEALLYKLSPNFKKDLVNVNSYSMVLVLITVALGGFLGSVNILIPILLDALFYLISFALMFGITESKKDVEVVDNNIFSFALAGIKYLASNSNLILLFGLNIPLSVLLLSLKWIYNPLFESYKIPQFYWGIVISFFSLIIIGGSLFYKKFKDIDNKKILWFSLLFLISLLTTSFTSYIYISVISFILMHFLLKFIDMYYVVEVNNHIKDNIRSSLVSLKSLLIRLSSSLYLLFIGFILRGYTINYLFVFTSIVIVFIWGTFLLLYRKRP